MTTRVPVFVCGEPARGDDAAGLAAVELLAADVRARAEIHAKNRPARRPVPAGPAGRRALRGRGRGGRHSARGDLGPPPAGARRPGACPGGRGRAPGAQSSHELPLEQVLALAAILRDAPPAGTFVGIGGSCWDVGTPLTAAVAAGLPDCAAAIAAAIEAYSGQELADRGGARRLDEQLWLHGLAGDQVEHGRHDRGAVPLREVGRVAEIVLVRADQRARGLVAALPGDPDIALAAGRLAAARAPRAASPLTATTMIFDLPARVARTSVIAVVASGSVSIARPTCSPVTGQTAEKPWR